MSATTHASRERGRDVSLARDWHPYVPWLLVPVIGGACSVAMAWAFLVPMLASPDEVLHLDYGLAISSEGRLITAREKPIVFLSNPYAAYLWQRMSLTELAYDPAAHVPADYNSPAYWASIDAGAAKLSSSGVPRSDANPWLVRWYPFAYYALLAVWLGLLGNFGHGIVFTFFAARLLSVLLLGLSLLVAYRICRELRIGSGRSIAIVAAVGFLPLTSFVSSAVQADALTMLVASLSIWLALLGRRQAGRLRWFALLGLALGVLLVTKYHVYLVLVLPVAAAVLLTRPRQHSWLKVAALAIPSVLLGAVQAWIFWGFPAVYGGHSVEDYGAWSFLPLRNAIGGGPTALLHYLAHNSTAAVVDFFGLHGQTFTTFWGNFGYLNTPLVVHSAAVTALVFDAIFGLTIAVLLLTLARLTSVGLRLWRVARSGRPGTALGLTVANPAINAYLLFVVFMLAAYSLSSNTFFGQGRNWFPLLLGMVLVATWYAPRVFRRRGRLIANGLLLAFIAFDAVGGAYALSSIRHRYYGPATNPVAAAVSDSTLAPKSGPTASALDLQYYLTIVPNGLGQAHPESDGKPPGPLVLAAGDLLAVGGWAVDLPAGTAARGVRILIDNQQFVANYGLDRPDVAALLQEGAYRRSGFHAVLPTNSLAPGDHRLRLWILSADGSGYYDSGKSIYFAIKSCQTFRPPADLDCPFPADIVPR